MAKKPRPYTVTSLERAAVRYLQRYPASEARLRQVLARKLERAKDFDRVVEDDPQEMIQSVIETCRLAGYIDDALYAKALVQSEHRKGRPLRVIAKKLREKGVPNEIGQEALGALKERSEDVDLVAAHAFARRRRLGQYRLKELAEEARRERARKDLAAMARAGFGYGVAKRALEQEEDFDH